MTAIGFPAFPVTRRKPGRFAGTWWGNAWLQAMADTSLDLAQLKRGRRFAYAGLVGPITVSAGRIAAQVTSDDGAVHHTVVLVDRLSAPQWRRFLDEVAAKAGHLAALLDRDMPHDLVEAAADADVTLLPGIGDLQPECDCEGWELPCTHAAALCFQAAWLLDADPFVLLLLRGLGQDDLTEELRRRATSRRQDDAVPALERPEVPEVGPLPPVSGPPRELVVPPAPGIDPDELADIAARAAKRARKLLTEHTG
ncbi:SWIM zinc finger family protein [Actinophytocola glycyrrhizae]|uniref:SWIM zinc finger family protein n=1 Tax=Actinophytocola glycyrrhizae TaxID=2044873 RepID=A0ABV9RYS7_9PSEU